VLNNPLGATSTRVIRLRDQRRAPSMERIQVLREQYYPMVLSSI